MPHASLHPIHPQLLSATQAQKVLVIDDVEMNAVLVASVVGTLCDVQTATSSRLGLEMALHYQPDLILLDVLMPEMDGFEVFRHLKSDPRTAQIPVIFLTAVSDVSAEEIGLNMGAADFIAKPFRTAALLARVRNHLQLAQQRVLLERLSHSDGLTGIANRRYFNTMLAREFSRMQRNRLPLALIMLDVDDFKAFNDHYGHVHGDECLQQVAQSIAACLQRPADMVARYGGEEFVCLLPETSAEGALKLARDIQSAITALRLPHVQSQAGDFVSVSMGVAAEVPSSQRNSQQLLSLADERLYRAKRGGRNRIVSSAADTEADTATVVQPSDIHG